MPAHINTKPMKSSTKLLLTGILTVITIVLAGELFDAIGVIYGPTQAGLSGIAGIVGSFKLFSGA